MVPLGRVSSTKQGLAGKKSVEASKYMDKYIICVQLCFRAQNENKTEKVNPMRAAVISERNALPIVGEFREPEAQEGAVLIDVYTAGLGGWDVLGAYRLGVEYPCVIRGEGVG
ncbi:MAG: hypothetical protein RR014_05130, partial [Bilophila sp.]